MRPIASDSSLLDTLELVSAKIQNTLLSDANGLTLKQAYARANQLNRLMKQVDAVHDAISNGVL